MAYKHKNSKRPYRHVTAVTVAKHKAQVIVSGNGTRAVLDTNDDYDAPEQRATYILKVAQDLATPDFIDEAMQQIGRDAMQTLGNAVTSTDEAIALRASTYTIDHLRGKAVQRSENKNLNISIESVL